MSKAPEMTQILAIQCAGIAFFVIFSSVLSPAPQSVIPNSINYDLLSGLSNEIKSKLKIIKPKTLGQALRVDGVTPAAIIIILSYLRRSKIKKTA